MVSQPVALQGRNQGIYPGVQAELGPEHTQQSDRQHKGTNRPLSVFQVDEQVDQQDRPGEKDHRFVEVGQRGSSV